MKAMSSRNSLQPPNPYEPPNTVETNSADSPGLDSPELGQSGDSQTTSTDDEVRALIWVMVGAMAFLLILGMSRALGGWHGLMLPPIAISIFAAWRVTVIGGKRWDEWTDS